MKTAELYAFVDSTDVSRTEPADQRSMIAILGLVGEIGSVVTAVKKELVSDPNQQDEANRFLVRGELKEEIGDALWYAVMLALCLKDQEHDPAADDIFKAGIERLKYHLTGKSRDNRRTQKQLKHDQITKFISSSGHYLSDPHASIDDYQEIAYQTKRTSELELCRVCTAVLQQLAAQLSRDLLPDSELILNHELRPKDPVKALGEILWHLAALASLYDIKLSACVAVTKEKSNFRNPQAMPGPDHSLSGETDEQFPDTFEVHFLDDGQGRTTMYWVQEGVVKKKLGSSLTDNNHSGDGYRFHDVMHIAFAAYLGWSPNLRSFMGLKRKSNDALDEVEDGGRAKILEEALILQIHETAQAKRRHLQDAGVENVGSPYNHEYALNFEFLKRLHDITFGHEVYANPKQDWEDAIINGYDCYHRLVQTSGGVISVDTKAKQISFSALDKSNLLDYSAPAIPEDD